MSRRTCSTRILAVRDRPHYNGYNVAFQPARMTPDELLAAHRELWNRAFGPHLVLERLTHAKRRLSRGGLMLAAAMNGFYGLKRLTGNTPATAPIAAAHRIAHPQPPAFRMQAL